MNKQYDVTLSATNTVRIEAVNSQEARAKALELGVFECFDEADYDIWHVEQIGDDEVLIDD